jgi:hypothetical protein
MRLSTSTEFRFWLTVYAFPALVPLVMLVAFNHWVKGGLAVALGERGPAVASNVSTALSASFVGLVFLANGCAYWHAATRKPAVPGPAGPG